MNESKLSENRLPLYFVDSIRNYTQLVRRGDVCLYNVYDREEKSHHFEVIIARNIQEKTVGSVIFAGGEIYPQEDEFGEWGWIPMNPQSRREALDLFEKKYHEWESGLIKEGI